MDYIKTYNYVAELFKDDVDKGGSPYIGHLDRVAKKCMDVSEDAVLMGLLHDAVEDKGISSNELMDMGYSLNVVDGLMHLSRLDGVPYDMYMTLLLQRDNIDALYVKKADLEDNMDLSRLRSITEKDINRLEKRYIPSWKKVVKRIKELESK